jgi:hypothetical protein
MLYLAYLEETNVISLRTLSKNTGFFNCCMAARKTDLLKKDYMALNDCSLKINLLIIVAA